MPRTKSYNRADILSKAIDIFWRKGYNGTSMQDLVDHLGINRSSIYDEFDNKAGLYKAALQQYKTDNRSVILSKLKEVNNPIQVIEDIMYMALADDKKDPKGCFIVNATTEYQDCRGDIQSELADNKQRLVKIFTDLLDQAKSQGHEFNGSSKAIANYLYTFMSGVQVMSKIEKDKIRLKETIKTGLSILH